jgi:phosphohistidine phosphatase
MSLTLFLLRHAEAEPARPNHRDFDRELSPKGIQQTTRLSEKLAKLKLSADYIISSPAMRAKTTATAIAQSLKKESAHIHFIDSLYEADVMQWMDVIQSIDQGYKKLLIIGHNPAISLLANYLSTDFKDGIGTCDFVWIEFEKPDWNSIHEHSGKVKAFIRS